MFRRIWLFLRELVWTAIGSFALIIVSIGSALAGANFVTVSALGLGAVALAILATRS
jgi:hypothetical protein